MAELAELLEQLEELEELVSRPAAGPIRLVVLQPTPYCNLDCRYCYLPHRNDRQRMSDATLDAIGRNILASPLADSSITVVWHGGEPMTLPPAWYDAAFARLAAAAPGRSLQHAFQTNALGVDASWLELWRLWMVRIGVSLDGPEDLHDRHRRTRRGGGSFALTMRGVEQLQAAGWPFHVISVLTADALAEPDRMLDFYLAHDLRDVGFNVEEEEAAHRLSSLREPGADAAYRAFLARFVQRLQDSGERFACRELDAVRWLTLAMPEARRQNPQTTPLEIVSVAVDGTMSTFSPEFLGASAPQFDDFAFGNVRDAGPEAMLDHPSFRRLHADIVAGVEACRRTCSYFGVCGGGAPANKLFELGSCRGTETLYCRLTRQAALDVILQALEGRYDAA